MVNGAVYNSLAVKETSSLHVLRSLLFNISVLIVVGLMTGILVILGLSVVNRL